MLLTLWERARIATRRALAKGALGPILTTAHKIDDDGSRFTVRVVSSLDAKERAQRARPLAENPFLSPDPDLVIGDVPPSHALLLNKFPVVEDHLLLVTRAFEDQTSLLTRADFEALGACAHGHGALAFYNAGEIAGASQRHRHLQLVRAEVPLEGRIKRGDLPFAHAFADRPADPERAHAQYLDLLAKIDVRDGSPYNLLITDGWMFAVPRKRESFEGVSVNALAFAGLLLARTPAELERVREIGPMTILKSV